MTNPQEYEMRRKPMNRYHAAKKFNRATSKTKAINVAFHAARGGYRL